MQQLVGHLSRNILTMFFIFIWRSGTKISQKTFRFQANLWKPWKFSTANDLHYMVLNLLIAIIVIILEAIKIIHLLLYSEFLREKNNTNFVNWLSSMKIFPSKYMYLSLAFTNMALNTPNTTLLRILPNPGRSFAESIPLQIASVNNTVKPLVKAIMNEIVKMPRSSYVKFCLSFQ